MPCYLRRRPTQRPSTNIIVFLERSTEGQVKRGARVRLIRDEVVIHEGELSQLKRFKDDAKEVKDGMECGMAFANYQDIPQGDMIECFETEKIARLKKKERDSILAEYEKRAASSKLISINN